MQPQFVSAPLIAQVCTFGRKLGFVQTFQFQNVHQIIYKHVKQHFSQKVNNLESKIFEWYKQNILLSDGVSRPPCNSSDPIIARCMNTSITTALIFYQRKSAEFARKCSEPDLYFWAASMVATPPGRWLGCSHKVGMIIPCVINPNRQSAPPVSAALSRKWKSWPFVFSQVPRVTN